METAIKEAAKLIKASEKTIAFTGAGISVESGIPPFRGEMGLWNKYAPKVLDLDFFKSNPKESWKVIKEIFYDFFGVAKPNKAHYVLAKMEENNLLDCVITQNIDNLHQEAGSKTVHEFHGNSHQMVCMSCHAIYHFREIDLSEKIPSCKKCGGILKPDFIFFGEGIPQDAYTNSVKAAQTCDVCIIIGSTGEVMPANYIPVIAKENGSKIIEVNPNDSSFTDYITDIHLKGKASEIMELLEKEILL